MTASTLRRAPARRGAVAWTLPLGLLVSVALLSGAKGQVAWTGHRLLAECARADGATPTSDCAIYIRAVVDRYHEVLATDCPHTDTTLADIVRGVTAYLAQHAAELDRPGPDLVLESLRQTYHCGLSRPRPASRGPD